MIALQHAQARHEAEHTTQSHAALAQATINDWLNAAIEDDELDEILTEAVNQ